MIRLFGSRRIQRKYTPKAPLYDHALLPNLAFIRAFEAECLLVMANPGVGSATDLLSSGPAHGSAAAALEQWGRALVGRDNTYDRGFFGQSGVWAPLAGKMADVGINEGACDARLSFEVIRVRLISQQRGHLGAPLKSLIPCA